MGMIMKVLIVDDEIRLGRLVQKLIPWDELGFIDMGCCTDSVEALQKIREEKPDLVITDVRMPRITGLELIEKVREFDKRVLFIIISGYSDFSYAQKAMRFGVEDYILKPIRQSELLDTLKKVDAKYKKIVSEAMEKEILETEVISGRMNDRSRFFGRLLSGTERLSDKISLEELNKKYSMNFRPGMFRVLLIHFLYCGEGQDKVQEFIFEKVEQTLENTLKLCYEYMVYKNQHIFAVLLNGEEETLHLLLKDVRKIRNELKIYQEFLVEKRVYFYLTDSMGDEQELAGLHECLEKISIQRFSNTNFSVLKNPEKPLEYKVLPDKFYEDFVYHIETLNKRELQVQCQQIIDFIGSCNETAALAVYDTYIGLRNRFAGLLKGEGFSEYARIENSLNEIFANSDEMEDLFYRVFEKIAGEYEKIVNTEKEQIKKPMTLAKEYIDHHFSEILSLEIVGNIIGLNASYLSSQFKKEMGISFIDYVNMVRIREAQKLLLRTDDNLNTIAEKVGFSDAKYFSRMFKKETGIKPSDYRKLLS